MTNTLDISDKLIKNVATRIEDAGMYLEEVDILGVCKDLLKRDHNETTLVDNPVLFWKLVEDNLA